MRLLPHDEELGWTPYAWTVYLTFFAVYPALKKMPTAGEWVATIAACVVFLALYFRGYWVHGRQLLLILSAIAAIGVIYLPFNNGAGCFFIYAAAFAAFVGTTRQAVVIIVSLELVLLFEVWLIGAPTVTWLWAAIFTALVGGVNVHFAQVSRSNAKLRLAQGEIEHLAKVAERERIARDLHDLLGHTLSVIILKSELAAKLAERDAVRARDEIQDVERISREALAQVRSAVRGYRSGGLQQELEQAREALSAAGVTLTAKLESVTLPPALEAVLALAMREAVTNIVRHARASQCRIALHAENGSCVLTVEDNGRGGESQFGDGLNGMRERIEALGGSMTRDGSRGTTLRITLPHPSAPALEASA